MVSAHAAAISVGSGGSGTITFSSPADTNAWTTASRLPNSGTAFADGAALDAAVQTNTAPSIPASATSSPVNAALTVDNTGAQQNSSRWNSTSGWLYTRPTGNSYQLLMAQLQNDSGACVNAITISFDMSSYSPATAELPGWHVYYSLTGAAGSWTLIPALSDVVVTDTLTANVTLSANWNAGASMYLLWADDNGNGVTDPGYTIDNLSISVTPCNLTCVGITNQPQNATVGERGRATFSIMATGSPQTIQWYRQNSGGGGFTPIPGANSATYALNSALYPDDNGAQFRASVSNAVCNVTSSTATLTVLPDTNAPVVVSAIGQVALDTIIITFSEPMDPGVLDPGSFYLYEAGFVGDPATTPYNTYSLTLTNGTNVIMQTDPRDLNKNYFVQVAYAQDNSFNHNVISPAPSDIAVRQQLPLIGFDVNNEWLYNTQTNLFGTGWETVSGGTVPESDPSWLSGPAGLGLDASVNAVPIRTTTAYVNGSSAPQFFRRHFTLPAGTNGTVLTMRYLFEDGAVVYLNGQEAGRFNVGAGALSVTTRSPAAITDPTPISGPVTLPLTNVVPGDNVIAVVVIQAGAASTDSEMALELTAEVQTILTGPPVVTGQPQNQTVNEGQSAALTVVAQGQVPLNYTWHKGGSIVPGQTAATLSFTPAVPADSGTYYASVTNSLGGTNSLTATLTVVPDTTAPIIVSAIGGTNGTTVAVLLRDPAPGTGIKASTASNAANYQVHLTAGGGDIAVLSATAAPSGGDTLVTLTLASALTQGQNYSVFLNGVTDNAVTPNAVSPGSAPITQSFVLFGFNSIWRYDQSGLNLGTTWKDPGFNDSLWQSGPGVLGFETSAGTLTLFTNIAGGSGTNTVLSLTNNNGGGINNGGTNVTITFYFRANVNIPFDPNAPGNSIVAHAYIDDGAILYINGNERVRFNQTNGPGYTNLANGALTETSQTFVTTNLTGFVQGNNLIAVEIHQDSLNSSDIDWALELQAIASGVTPPAQVHVSFNGSQVTLTWSGSCTLQETSQLANPSSNTVWSNSSRQNGVPFTPSGPMKFYRLSCP